MSRQLNSTNPESVFQTVHELVPTYNYHSEIARAETASAVDK